MVLTMYAGDDQLFGALERGHRPSSQRTHRPRMSYRGSPCSQSPGPSPPPTSLRRCDAECPNRTPTVPREKEVLDLLAEGLGVAQISRRLFISDSTTKTHISKLYEKLGAGNRAQAIMAAFRLGLIQAPETGALTPTERLTPIHPNRGHPIGQGSPNCQSIAAAAKHDPHHWANRSPTGGPGHPTSSGNNGTTGHGGITE